MATERARADELAARSIEAIEADRRVPLAYGVSRDAYLAARGETDALAWQLAEMPAHQLRLVADYLTGLLTREPLRSRPTYEPPRVVTGLLVLALEHIVARLGDDDDASLARPPAYAAAVARVNAAAPDILADIDRDLSPSTPSPEEPTPDAPAWFTDTDADQPA